MALRADADEAGGLLISRDNTDFGPGISQAKRDTIRVVTGMRGELGSSLSYDASLNFGRTRVTDTFSSRVLADRFLAATDAVLLSDGSVVCRSDIDPSALASAPFLPEIEPGFFTFRPGDGQCRPANLFRGANSVSPESVAFFTRPTTDRFKLDQTVASVSVEGDTTGTFSLPGGAVSYAMGVEYRKERSRSTFSNEQLGILDDGTFIGDISSNVNLIFDDQVRQFNAAGSFDVTEVFGEARLPLLSGMPLAYELSLEAAARWANYSTIGKATTWNLAATWAPARDFRLRGSYGKAIRAPDIFELFSPRQAATFRPSDPCNISDLNARVAAGLPNAETRKSNCAISLTALGVDPSTYEDPLTARFAGTTGGNPNLRQERATTWTAGFVLQPSGAHGLTLSLDYYSIQIRDAIAAVTSQDIVNSCYDLATFPNQFCTLFDRRADGGFSSLQQARINFGRIEVSGVDLSAAYDLHVGGGRLSLRSTLNWTEKLNRFFDPVQTDRVNPGLGELGVPEWSAVNSVTWTPGRLSLTWRGQYIGKQAVASVIQIEDIATEFGPAGFADAMWVHGIAASYELHPGFELFGGVSNLTDQKPYVASSAYPVSGIGRTFYAGLRARF
jgi:outer membrane receptor protein involved in Fe transport